MTLRTLLMAFVLAVLAPLTSAQAQRGEDRWELLGEQKVAFSADSDRIRINQNEGWFRSRAFRTLRFTVDRADIELRSIRIVYINGHAEELNVGRTIRQGGELVVDLPGERSYLREIDLRYRSKLGLSIGPGGISIKQGLVKVYGERAGRRIESPPPAPMPPPVAAGWNEIDTQRFDRRDSRINMRSSLADGRFGQIRFRSLGEAVQIRDVVIRYRNGETQVARVGERLANGQESRAIDLTGDQRFLESVTVNLDPRAQPGRAELQLLGTRRAGHQTSERPFEDSYTARGWIPLGQQTVGFTADRDVINVGQGEEFFRNRAFTALHLVVERNDITMRSVRVTYLNGHTEDIAVDREIRQGSDLAVDLRGDRSYIRQIELSYRSRPSFRGQAVVKVYGVPARR